MRNSLLVMALMCSAAFPARASDATLMMHSGNDFVRQCSSMDRPGKETEVEVMQSAMCAAYVRGLDEGIRLELALVKHDGKAQVAGPYCAPDGVEVGQMVRILLKYVGENPAVAHLNTAVLFAYAMKEAFPCRE